MIPHPSARRIDAKYYRFKEEEARDAAETFTYCAFCPDWKFFGTAGEGRERATEHRLEAHPEITRYRRRMTRSLHNFRQRTLEGEEWQEINDARRKRALLTGVKLED